MDDAYSMSAWPLGVFLGGFWRVCGVYAGRFCTYPVFPVSPNSLEWSCF